MKRRTFLKSAALASVNLPGIARAAERSSGDRANDDTLLAEARERIAKHRQAAGVVSVRAADGTPVPGAEVKVEQLRHEFLFGCNFFMFGRVGNPEQEEAYRARFAELLNYATLGFYWGAYEREQGKPNYAYTDGVIDWCRGRGITLKGHPLAWDHPASSPRWLPAEPAEVERLSTARVRDIVEQFKGGIQIWDVVNEPTDLTRFKNAMNTWAKALGAVPFTKLHLKVARAANPSATLLVNDYRTDPAFYRILDALREDGRLMFDAVGIQSHMHDGGWPLRRIWDVCDAFAKLGLPVHFTETTVVSGPRTGPGENWGGTTPELEARQADYVTRFYTMVFAHPATQALTWWDFSDRGAWQRAAAGLVRADMSPKPVYERLRDLIKGQWWTRAETTTNQSGEAAISAFFGRHRVSVKTPSGATQTVEADWSRAKPNRVVVALA